MRELLGIGVIALGFGALASIASEEPGWFAVANFSIGAAALIGGGLRALLRARQASAPAFRRPLAVGLGRIVLAVLAAVAVERGVAALGVQLDWSFERKFEPAPATLEALQALCAEGEVEALLFRDDFDPRKRSTRILLQTLAGRSCLVFHEHRLGDALELEDRFGVGTSNTVILRFLPADREESAELIDRPTEGTVYEALALIRSRQAGLLWIATGTGEGNLESLRDDGYSGFAAALTAEGYALHQFVSPAVSEIPDEVDAVLWIAPERALPEETLAALDRYLLRGGRLVVWLEPGSESGLEGLLTRWGIEPTGGVVVDPASAPLDGCVPGLCPLVYAYATSPPVARGLDSTRMTFFRGARSFRLRKPMVDDRLDQVALASPRSWIHPGLDALSRGKAPERPAGVRGDYHPLVVAGRYPRADHEVRIVAFGDAHLAANHDLRAVYNLDLAVNAVHWATSREADISQRPKVAVSGSMQFALPLQNTFTRFQGLGLLLPELLLIVGAIVWVRTRTA
jgi:hypothetical protein